MTAASPIAVQAISEGSVGLSLPFMTAGCLLVEMATGEPLFPGKTDIDQLWLIMKTTGHLTRHQMQVMQRNPHLASIRVPPRQMRDTLECRFPRLTHDQLHFVKVTCLNQVCVLSTAAIDDTCNDGKAEAFLFLSVLLMFDKRTEQCMAGVTYKQNAMLTVENCTLCML